MNILVIGYGFLGKNTVHRLRQKGYNVFSASRSGEVDFKIDIGKNNSLNELPKSFFDIVINTATILPTGNYLDPQHLESIYKVNIFGSQNIAKWINEDGTKIKHIINCSSLAVVNKPWPIDLDENAYTYPTGNHTLYASSKLVQELIFNTLAQQKEIKLANLRFSALYGESMKKEGVLWNFINQSLNTSKINLTNGRFVSADFLHIKDASKIIECAIENEVEGIINCASGEETFLNELATLIALKTQLKNKVEVTDTASNTEYNRSKININKLKEFCETQNFIPFSDGLDQIITECL